MKLPNIFFFVFFGSGVEDDSREASPMAKRGTPGKGLAEEEDDVDDDDEEEEVGTGLGE